MTRRQGHGHTTPIPRWPLSRGRSARTCVDPPPPHWSLGRDLRRANALPRTFHPSRRSQPRACPHAARTRCASAASASRRRCAAREPPSGSACAARSALSTRPSSHSAHTACQSTSDVSGTSAYSYPPRRGMGQAKERKGRRSTGARASATQLLIVPARCHPRARWAL